LAKVLKRSSNKELLGCVGAIGGALITGLITLIIASPVWVPFFFPTPTPIVANEPQPTNIAIAPPTSVIVPPTSIIIIAPTNPPVATEVVQVAPASTATPDCWQTVWSFNPSGNGDITTLLSPPRTGYSTSFDTSIYADSPGSLKIETSKIVKDPMKDANAWTWMDNNQTIIANNGLYRQYLRQK
jgi:hypothetical protein